MVYFVGVTVFVFNSQTEAMKRKRSIQEDLCRKRRKARREEEELLKKLTKKDRFVWELGSIWRERLAEVYPYRLDHPDCYIQRLKAHNLHFAFMDSYLSEGWPPTTVYWKLMGYALGWKYV